MSSTREALEEKAAWMHQVVEEEHSKPLVVDAGFTADYERRERLDEERLEEEVGRHVASLRRLRGKLQDREEVRQRNVRYKRDMAALSAGQRLETQPEDEFDDEVGDMAVTSEVTGTLSKVLLSLDKLVDLEKRITHLEGAASQSSLQFTRRRAEATSSEPAKTVFTVEQASTRGRLPRMQQSSGGRGGARGRGSASTGSREFQTSLPQVQRNRIAGGAGRRQHAGVATGGAGGGRGASQRQDAAASAWLRQNKAGRSRPGERTATGAASGRRTGNQSMQQFHDIRREFEKKKDAIARNITKPPANAARRKAW